MTVSRPFFIHNAWKTQLLSNYSFANPFYSYSTSGKLYGKLNNLLALLKILPVCVIFYFMNPLWIQMFARLGCFSILCVLSGLCYLFLLVITLLTKARVPQMSASSGLYCFTTGLLSLAWMDNYTHYKMCDIITYPLQNFNCANVERCNRWCLRLGN